MNKEIEIPEGYEAKIVGNKVVFEQKESEDERIRQEIHAYLFKTLHNTQQLTPRTNDFERWLSYLERQKEQTKEYPHSVIENAISFLAERNDGMPKDEARNIVNAVISVIKPEHWPIYMIQMPAEWSEEDQRMLERVINSQKHVIPVPGKNGFEDMTTREEEDTDAIKWLRELPSRIRPVQEWSEEDKENKETAIRFLNTFAYRANLFDENGEIKSHALRSCVDWLKSLRPQPKQEWSEEYREEDLRTRFAFYTYKDENDVLYLSNVFVGETSRNKGFGTKILQSAEKVAETTGATTIRLKVKHDSPANVWYRKNGYGYMTFEDVYDWLEKKL